MANYVLPCFLFLLFGVAAPYVAETSLLQQLSCLSLPGAGIPDKTYHTLMTSWLIQRKVQEKKKEPIFTSVVNGGLWSHRQKYLFLPTISSS